MMRICLMNVDLPDSPVPVATDKQADRSGIRPGPRTSLVLTEQQEFEFAASIALIFPQLSFDLLIDPLLLLRLLTEAAGHYFRQNGGLKMRPECKRRVATGGWDVGSQAPALSLLTATPFLTSVTPAPGLRIGRGIW